MKAPRILLAGLGQFGQEHLRVLRALENEGLVKLAGLLVRRPPPIAIDLPVYLDPLAVDVSQFDAVDIVTPVETHAELIRRFLPYLDVLVEKPMASTIEDALEIERLSGESKQILMVNHLYRFHPTVLRLRDLIVEHAGEAPTAVHVVLTNPVDLSLVHRPAPLEFLHVFDIVDAIYRPGTCPKVSWCKKEVTWHADLEFPAGLNANVVFGWAGSGRIRTIEIAYGERKYRADLSGLKLQRWDGDICEQIECSGSARLLEPALRVFLDAIDGRTCDFPSAAVGRRIVQTSLSLTETNWKPDPARDAF